MFFRQIVRNSLRQTQRTFSSTARKAVHFEEGVYTNIPFKVHNRKIPYAVVHFSFFGLAFAIPFVAIYVQLKRSGAF